MSGELTFEGSFAVGDAVTKPSAIVSVSFKTGATGPLAFVSVRRVCAIAGRRTRNERQDIVYQSPPGESAKQSAAKAIAAFTVDQPRQCEMAWVPNADRRAERPDE